MDQTDCIRQVPSATKILGISQTGNEVKGTVRPTYNNIRLQHCHMTLKIGLSCLGCGVGLNQLSTFLCRVRLGAVLSATQHCPRSRRCLGASISTMGCKPPARVGDSLVDIETPALIIKLNELERNIRHLPTPLQDTGGVAIRPHAKAHKCPVIGQLQVRPRVSEEMHFIRQANRLNLCFKVVFY